MNVNSFINSKDVEKYLSDIGYEFSPIEQAWIVWHSDNKTITERLNAWEEISKQYPKYQYKSNSLSSQLRWYCDFVRFYCRIFMVQLEECYYTCKVHERDVDYWYDGRHHPVFKSYQECIDWLKKEYGDAYYENFSKIDKIILRKNKFNNKEWYREITFNNKFEMLKIEVSGDYERPEDSNIDYFFENMWFRFPTPFKKGDLVSSRHHPFEGERFQSEPFVLEHLITWEDETRIVDMLKSADYTDMTAYGYFQREDGSLYWECIHDYFDLEYYKEEPKNERKILFALSNYFKNEISIDALLDAYKIHMLDKELVGTRRLLNLTKEGMRLIGV